MGDHNPNFALLPPGCRFFPSDEQLLCVYLTQKNKSSGDRRSVLDDLIKEIDLYDFEPFNLPDSVCFRFGRGGGKRHYYCYVARVSREEERRRAGTGFWKRSGRVRDVFVGGGSGKVIVGTRRSFVFYLGDFVGAGGSRTDWFMHEYALIQSHLAPFVLCRVFVRSRTSNRSERPLSSCGEGSVATVRHIGVQHDGAVKLAANESNLLGRNSPDHKNNVLRFPMGMVRELDNQVIGWPVDLQMRSFGHTNARDVILDPLTARELTAILEDDFLELDDLVSPRLGID